MPMFVHERSADTKDNRSEGKKTERLYLFRSAFLPRSAPEKGAAAVEDAAPRKFASTTQVWWRPGRDRDASASPPPPSRADPTAPDAIDVLRRSLARAQTFSIIAGGERAQGTDAPRRVAREPVSDAPRDDAIALAIASEPAEDGEPPDAASAAAPSAPRAVPHDQDATPLRDVSASSAVHQPAGGAEPDLAERSTHVRTPAIDPFARTAPISRSSDLKLSARSPLFRAEALAAYQRGERLASVLRITDRARWTLLSALGLALALALALALFGRVDEISTARGLLRAPFGISPVVPLLGGTIRELLVTPGAHVQRGEVLARLDAAPLSAALDEATQRLALAERQWERQREQLVASHRQRAAILSARMALLARRRDRQELRVERRRAQAERLAAPELAEVLEVSAREESLEVLEGARDETLRTGEELAMLELQLAAEKGDHAQQLAAGDARIDELRTQRTAAAALLEQTELRAPSSGKLESQRLQVGLVVQPNEWVGRIVSEEPLRTMVSFVPDRDAAFLRAGARANVELDQLPLIEFGQLPARVERVGSELADPAELARELGDAAPSGPHVRVELTLEQGAALRRARPLLRPGALGTARIVLRERRLLSILFEPSRRWFH